MGRIKDYKLDVENAYVVLSDLFSLLDSPEFGKSKMKYNINLDKYKYFIQFLMSEINETNGFYRMTQ